MAKKTKQNDGESGVHWKTYSLKDGSWLDYIESAVSRLGLRKATVYRRAKSGKWTGEPGGDAVDFPRQVKRVRKHLTNGVDSKVLFDAVELGVLVHKLEERDALELKGDGWKLRRANQKKKQGNVTQGVKRKQRAARARELLPEITKQLMGKTKGAIYEEIGLRIAEEEDSPIGFSRRSVGGWLKQTATLEIS